MGNQSAPYNLIHQPWIPVIRKEGGRDWIAPWQITEGISEHPGDPVLRLAAARPDFNGALHEFLIGLLTTCFTPDDEGVWRQYWHTPPPPDTLKQAFAAHQNAFNLDGDGPRFMQDFDVLEGTSVPVSGLLMDAPGSNTLVRNADHFIKRDGIAALGRPAAALALFTLQTYAPPGGAGHRTSLRGGGPLTTIVTDGDYLWERLWPNVENKGNIATRPGQSGAGDPAAIFPWLAPTRTSEKNTGRKVTPEDAHALQVYWGMPRRIRLNFTPGDKETCSLTGQGDTVIVKNYVTKNLGIDYSEGWNHPLSPYYRQTRDSPHLLPLHPQPGGISYRHWLGLVLKSDDDLGIPAQCIRNVQTRRDRSIKRPLLSAFGYDIYKHMKARAWVESVMPLQFFEDERVQQGIAALTPCLVHAAEYVAGQVTSAVKRALFDRPKEAKGDFSHISDRFWRETETNFFHLLDDAIGVFEKAREDEDVSIGLGRRWLDEVLRPTAERLFDEYASATDIEFKNMERLVSARYSLVSTLRGWGVKSTAPGVKLYGFLQIQTPAEEAKKAKQIAEAKA